MGEEFKVTLSGIIEKDGQPFCEASLVYSGMDRDDVIVTEAVVEETLGKLFELGRQKAKQ